jgi:hypothetical protein
MVVLDATITEMGKRGGQFWYYLRSPCQSQAWIWRATPAGLTAHWRIPPPSMIVPELETELH